MRITRALWGSGPNISGKCFSLGHIAPGDVANEPMVPFTEFRIFPTGRIRVSHAKGVNRIGRSVPFNDRHVLDLCWSQNITLIHLCPRWIRDLVNKYINELGYGAFKFYIVNVLLRNSYLHNFLGSHINNVGDDLMFFHAFNYCGQKTSVKYRSPDSRQHCIFRYSTANPYLWSLFLPVILRTCFRMRATIGNL